MHSHGQATSRPLTNSVNNFLQRGQLPTSPKFVSSLAKHGQAVARPLTTSVTSIGKYVKGNAGMYGSTHHLKTGTHLEEDILEEKSPFNIVAGCVTLFLPWFLFCVLFWEMSFSVHYWNPELSYFAVFVGFCVVLLTAYLAADAIKKHQDHRNHHGGHHDNEFQDRHNHSEKQEMAWPLFLFAACFVAWVLGTLAGDWNFAHHMEPYYDASNVNTYENIDPSRMRGNSMMDAGRIVFTPGTKLEQNLSIGFKDKDMYCVAPIGAGKGAPSVGTYDFWAVGLNCCSGVLGDFHCGEFNHAFKPFGLRLMRDDERPFFRLAVQKAEVTYNIRADHPLFFHWLHDPDAEVSAYLDEGYKYFLIGVFMHFCIMFLLVVSACFIFPKLSI